ncbi:VIN3-like protein 2 isoform X2 [Cornus florida]|uniref:VIN3-like protein 2 isoform X2 n=1 Tax=Cornus florida TaxID=4283 RepID=UPI00289777F3|nr:VIN3-like protein 2 isoform X2 [Cornus florida]
MRKPEGRFSGMDSGLSGSVNVPAKCSQLSLGERRELVHKIAQWSEDAPKVLTSFTRGELREIICAEMAKTEKRFKRQRKKDNPSPLPTELDHSHCGSFKENLRILICQNLACRATLSPEDVFCKRCSCCICHCYDDNKDPTLWLTCESDPPDEGESCGMSCHLRCAFRHEKAGLNDGCSTKLDGSFCCVSCGKINGIMRAWRRQLLVAKVARRVDALCLRVSLCHKILEGTEQYKELLKIVGTAAKTLENEVGPLDLACMKMDRGIVNRLSCGAEVQKMCSSAVETFDSMFSNPDSGYIKHKDSPTCRIHFEESSATTVIVVLEYEDCLLEEFLGCRVWHRKSTMKDYPEEASYIVLKPEKRFKLIDLDPSTEYFCKVSLFSNTGTLGTWEAKWLTPVSNGSSVPILHDHGEEKDALIVDAQLSKDLMNCSNTKLALGNHFAELQSLNDIKKNKNDGSLVLHSKIKLGDRFAKLQSLNDINNNNNDGSLALHPYTMKVSLASPTFNSPSTPCRSDKITELSGLGSKKHLKESDYEYSVRVIRWLENEGHIDTDFRVKFLTWFSLKATMQQRRVVSVFIDTFVDDPPSLAGQLIDTFTDEICNEQKLVLQPGFCMRLWH